MMRDAHTWDAVTVRATTSHLVAPRACETLFASQIVHDFPPRTCQRRDGNPQSVHPCSILSESIQWPDAGQRALACWLMRRPVSRALKSWLRAMPFFAPAWAADKLRGVHGCVHVEQYQEGPFAHHHDP